MCLCSRREVGQSRVLCPYPRQIRAGGLYRLRQRRISPVSTQTCVISSSSPTSARVQHTQGVASEISDSNYTRVRSATRSPGIYQNTSETRERFSWCPVVFAAERRLRVSRLCRVAQEFYTLYLKLSGGGGIRELSYIRILL